MNSASAVVYCRVWMRKLMKNTSPSVASMQQIIGGPPKIVWPNDVSAGDLPGRVGHDRGV